MRIKAQRSLPYMAIGDDSDDPTPRCNAFFIRSASTCGKTFLPMLILNKVRRELRITIAMAMSGIATLLLPGGSTAHLRFGIPVQFGRTSLLPIKG